MSGPQQLSMKERRARRLLGETQFLKECYGGVPQRFRYDGRLLFSTQDKDGSDMLLRIKES